MAVSGQRVWHLPVFAGSGHSLPFPSHTNDAGRHLVSHDVSAMGVADPNLADALFRRCHGSFLKAIAASRNSGRVKLHLAHKLTHRAGESAVVVVGRLLRSGENLILDNRGLAH